MLVSIIICTRNRADFLVPCLNAVASSIRTAKDQVNSEIVLVNNGSIDHTALVLDKWVEANQDIQLRVVLEEKAGLSNARNAGMAAAKGDLFVLTDDDCHMDQKYLITASDYDSKDVAPTIRGGRIDLGDHNDLPLTIKISNKIERWQKIDKTASKRPLSGAISGANIVVRRSVVDMLGPCDARLGAGMKIAGSEDTDYLCRAYIRGITIEYVPDLAVSHFHGRKTKEEARKLLRNYNIGAGAVYIKHIFNDFDLFRPFIWNIKNAINEIKQSKNLYLPEYDMSYKDILVFNLYGMWLYVYYSVLDRVT